MKKLFFFFIFLFVIFVSVFYGRYGLSFGGNILFKVRLPRTILAFTTGAILGIAGTIYQSILINPLAEPYILGVASSASLFMSFSVILGINYIFYPLWGIIGAFLSVVFILYSVAKRGYTGYNLLINGIMINIFAASFLTLMLFIAGKDANRILAILMGYINTLPFLRYPFLWLIIFASFLLLLFYGIKNGNKFDIVVLGDNYAFSLGVNAEQFRKRAFIIVSLIVGIIVSFVGIIGFVGFLSPHILRIMGIKRYGKLAPYAAITGGMILVFADFVGRNLWNTEVPAGVITAIIGVPFFIFIMRKKAYFYG